MTIKTAAAPDMTTPVVADPSPEIVARHAALQVQIAAANHAYYIEDAPTLSDAEYDALTIALRELEAAYPTLQAQSVTQQVGAPLSEDGVAKVTHAAPMLSLGNAFDVDEVMAWARRAGARADGTAWCVEAKIDGLSLALRYRAGHLVSAATRGDGVTGEDVLASARGVTGVPQQLVLTAAEAAVLSDLEIRGEVYLPLAAWEQANALRAARGGEPYKSPRNAAAGLLRHQETGLAAAAGLAFAGYQVVGVTLADLAQVGITTQEDLLRALERWGVGQHVAWSVATSLADAEQLAGTWWDQRDTLPAAIDGVVIKVNPLPLQEELGTVGRREPRWAIARKWSADGIWTTLERVDFQVGRTGRITPVGVVRPVEIGGVTVTNVTLHNEDYIHGLELHVGDRVALIRSGEVIPRVVQVDATARATTAVPVAMPSACPSCGGSLLRPEGASDTICPSMACGARLHGAVLHAVRRGALDIQGVGPELIEALLTAGLLTRWSDLFRLTAADLGQLPRMGPRRAAAVLEAIATARQAPLSSWIVALGLQGVGTTLAPSVAAVVGSLEGLLRVTPDTLMALEGIGRTTAEDIVANITFGTGDLIRDLLAQGIAPTVAPPTPAVQGMPPGDPAAAPAGRALAGEVIVVTGVFHGGSQWEVEGMLRAAGAEVAERVTRKTTLLLRGAAPGTTKVARAEKLGIQIVDEQTLLTPLRPPPGQRAGRR
jgi:DNA ligase (NAD+)